MGERLDAKESVQVETEFRLAVRDLREEVLRLIEQCARVGYCSIGKEVQQEVRSSAKALGARLSALKHIAIERVDESSANQLLALVFSVRALHGELTVWIALKDDRAEFAWARLVEAQGLVQAAMRADGHLEPVLSGLLRKLHTLEKLLFPPQIFFSIGAIIESIRCSICDEEYGTCRHLAGMPYMGKMCCEVLNEFRELKETSIVDSPEDKCCRAVNRQEGGEKIDMLTGRALPCDPDDEAGSMLANHIHLEGYIARFTQDTEPYPE
jgi:hypothetical protein